MRINFIHTADLQLGKPFHGVQDEDKRALLRTERFKVISRIGQAVIEHGAEFVIIAGDLFDSPTPTKSIVSQAFSGLGKIKGPIYVIPGNHDHGGPGGLWDQPFFKNEKDNLAPNVNVLLESVPVELENAILYPCPLLRRHESADLTSWLREFELMSNPLIQKPRIVIAHGTVEGFGALTNNEENEVRNYIDINRIPESKFDYIALGDWHGTRKINPKAWYSGTPELDRFIKSDAHNPGNILAVTAQYNQDPVVTVVKTSKMNWEELDFNFLADNGLDRFKNRLDELFQGRTNEDLLKLTLSGSLGLEAFSKLENMIETLHSRLIRLKLDNQVAIAPTDMELDELKNRQADPLISNVAKKLFIELLKNDEHADIVRVALRELYRACKQ